MFIGDAGGLSGRLQGQEITVAQILGPIVDDPNDARYADVAAAIEQLNSGDLAGTRTMLEEAAGKLPELPPAEAMMAQLLFFSGRPQSARGALEAATSTRPEDPEAYLMLGDIALREGRMTEAQLLYKQAETLCSAYDKNQRRRLRMQVGAYSGISAAAAARQGWPEVLRALEAWLKLEPKSAEANLRKGRAQFEQGDFQNAYATFQQARQLDPSVENPEVNMGQLYEVLARRGVAKYHESAKRAMQAAAQAEPDGLDTRLAIAQWALDSCEIDMAQDNAEAALKIAADSAEAMLLAAIVARHRGDAPRATQLLEAAHLRAPGEAAILQQLVYALLEQNQPEASAKSLEFARLAVASEGDRRQTAAGDAVVALAWALAKNGRQPDAEATVQSALQSGPLGEESAFYAAAILDGAGRGDMALPLLESALSSGACFPAQDAAKSLADKLRGSK
ncbi:MAG: tetratricopeptide repeat protein [Pirellulaceae bacterium]